MPADPVAAGRKGGQSRSAKKLAAIRRNGFQKAVAAVLPEMQAQAAAARAAGSPEPEIEQWNADAVELLKGAAAPTLLEQRKSA